MGGQRTMTHTAGGEGRSGGATPAAPDEYPPHMNVGKAENPMNIAVICPRFPLPMTRADQKTVAHLLAFLSARGHSVDLYSLYEGAPPSAEQREWIGDRCRDVTVFDQPGWRAAIGAGIALMRGLPLQIGWFDNPHLKRSLRRSSHGRRYHVIYSYTLRSAEPARGLGRSTAGREDENGDRLPVTYLAMQVSQSLNTRRIAAHAPGWWEKLMYFLENRLIAAYEARIWRDFTRTVLIGGADVREIRRICADKGMAGIDNYLLSPHGVDASRFHPHDDEGTEPCTLIFSGVMATNTNVNAVLWFVENVWPKIRSALPDARFIVAGRMPRRKIVALGKRPGITITGELPDPGDYIGRATVCINPMQAGAGMQNKLLEYMSMAKAIVATSIANEGIGARPGAEILIADDADDFAAGIISLLRDPERRRALGKAARTRVLRDWSWETHFLKIEADMVEQSDMLGQPAK